MTLLNSLGKFEVPLMGYGSLTQTERITGYKRKKKTAEKPCKLAPTPRKVSFPTAAEMSSPCEEPRPPFFSSKQCHGCFCVHPSDLHGVVSLGEEKAEWYVFMLCLRMHLKVCGRGV